MRMPCDIYDAVRTINWDTGEEEMTGMAKKPNDATSRRGPGSREEQLSRLRETVGPKGEADARAILETYPRDVIRYAVKIDDRRARVVRDILGRREKEVFESLKADLGVEEAENWKRLTLAGKKARKLRG